jgi:hypothetical protein
MGIAIARRTTALPFMTTLRKEENTMKKLTIRKVETLKTTSAFYGGGCGNGA